MIEFIGRLHPLLVHLPIGIFILVLIIECASFHEKRRHLSNQIDLFIAIGILFSLLSLVTGFILNNEGNNNTDEVDLHKWTALFTTSIYLAYLYLRKKIIQHRLIHIVSLFLLFLSLSVTGHLGGSLTHGSNYLSLDKPKKTTETVLDIKDINKAVLYKDIVQHTMQLKCVECHGNNKQKGKLRLDDSTWIVAGGKNGEVLNFKAPEQSELLKRLLLERNDEHHMPPKEKEQLTDFEAVLFQWWITNGASFTKQVDQLPTDPKINKALKEFQDYHSQPKEKNIERAAIEPISSQVKLALEKAGWVISTISQEDQHIRAVGFNLEKPLKQSIALLSLIQQHVVELKLSFSGVNDQDIESIKQLTNIEKLWLDGNALTDKSITNIASLKQLTYLNLRSTNISPDGISTLKQLPKLKSIYSN